jgi:HEAT repeat protein
MSLINEEDIAALLSGLRHQDKQKRAEITRKIAGLGSPAIPYLIPLLKDDDWIVRYRTAEALGMIGSEKVVPDLIAVCQDRKDHVRYMAAKSLTLLKSRTAAQVFVSLLRDEHPYTRGMSAEGLAAIGDPVGIAPLMSAINAEKNAELKERMIQSLSLLQKK